MANDTSIYNDIETRTGGDFYIGVVGPVRTGKSTFIKKFMDTMVLPNIQNEYDRTRAVDEMPQSAAGRTVMTTEPKFIPDEAVTVSLGDNATLRVKMIDCVGYVVPDALGIAEDGAPRMVHTPWSDEPVPFTEAAETGTRKVINDHSTIAVLMTTDGTIGEIDRAGYVDAEERVVRELNAIGKPFAVVLNSAKPESDYAAQLAYELESKYKAPVALVNVPELDRDDITQILEMILLEFPVTKIEINLPGWVDALDSDDAMRSSVSGELTRAAEGIDKVGTVASAFSSLDGGDYIERTEVESIDLGTGCAKIRVLLYEKLLYDTMSALTGMDITSEEELISSMMQLAKMKKTYDRISAALNDVNESGYGIVTPEIDDMTLEEPEIVRQSAGYGVKLKASAPSIHMIRADIETELNPVVGTEEQSEDLVKYLLKEFEEDPRKIWDSNIFGKTLHELINEGLNSKLEHMPKDARAKLSETLGRIINEGSGGLICILL